MKDDVVAGERSLRDVAFALRDATRHGADIEFHCLIGKGARYSLNSVRTSAGRSDAKTGPKTVLSESTTDYKGLWPSVIKILIRSKTAANPLLWKPLMRQRDTTVSVMESSAKLQISCSKLR